MSEKHKPLASEVETLTSLLIDATALLEHYVSNRPDNWDGSTRTQALATIVEVKAALVKMARKEARP